jgi:hypothetical protein
MVKSDFRQTRPLQEWPLLLCYGMLGWISEASNPFVSLDRIKITSGYQVQTGANVTEFFMKRTHDRRNVIRTVIRITRQTLASILAKGIGLDAKGRMK